MTRLREITSGGDPEPHGERLQIAIMFEIRMTLEGAVARTARQVGRPVARVHADRNQVARSRKRKELPPETGVLRTAIEPCTFTRLGHQTLRQPPGEAAVWGCHLPNECPCVFFD